MPGHGGAASQTPAVRSSSRTNLGQTNATFGDGAPRPNSSSITSGIDDNDENDTSLSSQNIRNPNSVSGRGASRSRSRGKGTGKRQESAGRTTKTKESTGSTGSTERTEVAETERNEPRHEQPESFSGEQVRRYIEKEVDNDLKATLGPAFDVIPEVCTSILSRVHSKGQQVSSWKAISQENKMKVVK